MTKKYLSRYFKLVGILFIFLFYVDTSFALLISEIQFDPAGSDTDREWIEIFNDTNQTLDLTTYKFLENNSNHGIDILSGDKNIASGEYVVLVQDLNKFKTDFPAFNGKIFKSSFSLSNTGESLSLKDKDGNILNTVNYSPTQTGAGNGLTINFDGSNYIKGSATPGSGNLVVGSAVISDQTNSTTTATSTQTTSSATTNISDGFVSPIYYSRSYWPESEKIYLYAGENKTGMSGGIVNFSAQAVTGDKKPVSNASFFWSFGDGQTAEGKNVKHIFKYNGEYVVNIEAYANGYRTDDKLYVKISDPDLDIKLRSIKDEKIVELSNNSKDEVDLGEFLILTKGGEFERTFTLPKHLSILPHKNVKLSQEILNFATNTSFISLNYTNGKLISEFVVDKSIQEKSKIQTKKFEMTTTTKILSVFTKEQFEINSLSSTATSSKDMQVVRVKKIIKLPQIKNSDKVVQIPQGDVRPILNENKFTVGENTPSPLFKLFKYFGI